MYKFNTGDFLTYGEDVFISEFAIIKHPHLCKIGNHVAIDNGVTFSTAVHIGDYVHIAPYVCTIGGKVSTITFKDFSFVAAGTKIVAGSEDYTGLGLVGPTIPIEYRTLIYGDIVFEKFSGCGVNCSVLPGVKFNEGSILGANSLATSDLEPWTIYVGSPAKPVKMRKKETILENAKKLGYEL
jgi:acetyltransferase-like isoleucine patch superfamily enzyme